MRGLVPLQEKTPESSVSLSLSKGTHQGKVILEHNKKADVYKIGRGFSLEPNHSGTLISEF